MSQYYTPKKSCYDFGLLAPNRYDMDFSNEVLNIHFGKGAAKKSEVKVRKQNCLLDHIWHWCAYAQGQTGRFLFDLQIWPLIFLQPLDQNECLVHHLKDLPHICLEPKVQDHRMTFKVYNVGSKYVPLFYIIERINAHIVLA